MSGSPWDRKKTMGLIKKERIVEKGVIDLMQDSYKSPAAASAPRQEDTSYSETNEEVEQIISDNPDNEVVLDDVYEKASQIINQAQAEAHEIVENANAEISLQCEKAREEGFEEGRRDGEQQVSDQMAEALDVLNQAIKERKRIIKDAEGELVRLSLKIAEQIIRSEVSLHRDVVMNIITEAIGRVSDRESVIIKVSRDDIEQVKNYKDRISGIVDGVKNLSILEDSQIEPGGCVIETNLGYVDARVSTKLNLIEQALKKAESSVSD